MSLRKTGQTIILENAFSRPGMGDFGSFNNNAAVLDRFSPAGNQQIRRHAVGILLWLFASGHAHDGRRLKPEPGPRSKLEGKGSVEGRKGQSAASCCRYEVEVEASGFPPALFSTCLFGLVHSPPDRRPARNASGLRAFLSQSRTYVHLHNLWYDLRFGDVKLQKGCGAFGPCVRIDPPSPSKTAST